jgi:hypothetical protein
MKRFLLFAVAATAFAQVPATKQVYLMPMAGGLDQYLATWLTREHALQVVTDPRAADLILTDRIGKAFENQLLDLYPPEKDPNDKNPAPIHNSFHSSASRGTIFLVDAKSRQVVWSDHEKPMNPTDKHLNREAERIVKKLAPPQAK